MGGAMDDAWLRALGEWKAAHRQAARSRRDLNQLVLWEVPDVLHVGADSCEHAAQSSLTHS